MAIVQNARRGNVLWTVVLALLVGGCGSSLYHLPPPTVAADREVGKDEGGEPAPSDAELDQQARAALLELYALVKSAQFEDAERYLSQETREFLSAVSATNDPSAALSSAEFKLGDGRTVQVDPVRLLFGGNIVSVQDALKEPDAGETPNRRVLHSVDPQGASHRIIMIFEGGQWVLHKTSIDAEQATAAP